MSTNDELQQAADEARKQREAAFAGHEAQNNAPPPDDDANAQPGADAPGGDTPQQQKPVPDFDRQFAEPDDADGETAAELRQRIADLERQLAEATARERSAAGRLKKSGETSGAEVQKLRDRNAELEAQIAELTAAAEAGGGDDDTLDAETKKSIERHVKRAITPLQERFQQTEREAQNLHARHDQERLANFHAGLAEAVPDYCDIANSPKWVEFLKTVEPMTGVPYGQLAGSAFKERNAARFSIVLNTFKQHQGLPVTQNPKVRAHMRPPANNSVTAPQGNAAPKVYTFAEFREHYNKVESDANYLKDPKNAALHEELKKARAENRITYD